ncbi:MAG: hypothetical protein R3D59_11975 [Paracoccaceae bacterium]
MQPDGTDTYIATDDLAVAVNAAVTLERPLLVKGEPAPARPSLPARWPRRWGCRSSSGTSSPPPWHQQGLYEYDAVRGCGQPARRGTRP